MLNKPRNARLCDSEIIAKNTKVEFGHFEKYVINSTQEAHTVH